MDRRSFAELSEYFIVTRIMQISGQVSSPFNMTSFKSSTLRLFLLLLLLLVNMLQKSRAVELTLARASIVLACHRTDGKYPGPCLSLEPMTTTAWLWYFPQYPTGRSCVIRQQQLVPIYLEFRKRNKSHLTSLSSRKSPGLNRQNGSTCVGSLQLQEH
jgi:hypothetical protein